MGYNNRPVRRGTLIGTFGVGSIIDFPKGESLMVCGLDVWPDAKSKCPSELYIEEERLQKRLNMSHFRLPPAYDDNFNASTRMHNVVPCVRFPQWHFCPRCGAMEQLGIFSSQNEKCKGRPMSNGRSCTEIPDRNKPHLTPMRFIAVCQNGHIDDFPYMEWVHRGKKHQPTCQLRMRTTGSSASLSSVIIECSCGDSRSMAGSFGRNASIKKCNGRRPWLGDHQNEGEGCLCDMQAAQRGAANVYFAQIVSSIHLPRKMDQVDDNILAVIEKQWGFFTSGMSGDQVDDTRITMAAEMFHLDKQKLKKAVEDKIRGTIDLLESEEALRDDELFRYQEYRALKDGNDSIVQDFYGKKQEMTKYQGLFMRMISGITLMKKLRETRVQIGFTRLTPTIESTDGVSVSSMSINPDLGWLPASVVHGEGIFIMLNDDMVNEWSAHPDVQKRMEVLTNRAKEVKMSRKTIKPKFVMMHTLAHLLINQLSFECGYGSSSIRERIYCDIEHQNEIMNGILLYTASGDSEGSLGGLVRQGEAGRFEDTLFKALQNSLWCSADPVCMQSHGQGPNALNLAACHNCALLPETSCEERNMLLDRKMVTGEFGLWKTLDESTLE